MQFLLRPAILKLELEEYLPIKVVFPDAKDTVRPETGGGPRKIFDEDNFAELTCPPKVVPMFKLGYGKTIKEEGYVKEAL